MTRSGHPVEEVDHVNFVIVQFRDASCGCEYKKRNCRSFLGPADICHTDFLCPSLSCPLQLPVPLFALPCRLFMAMADALLGNMVHIDLLLLLLYPLRTLFALPSQDNRAKRRITGNN
jgi:hypothetical protein